MRTDEPGAGWPTVPILLSFTRVTVNGAAVSVIPYPWIIGRPMPAKKCARSALSGAPPHATYRMFGPSAPRTARYTDVSNIACRARWLAECLPPSCSVRDHSRAHWAACANMRPLKPVPALRDAALYTFSNTRGTPSR